MFLRFRTIRVKGAIQGLAETSILNAKKDADEVIQFSC